MLAKIQEFISETQLLSKSDKTLIAVSGGRDSILLLILLHQLGYPVEVAHCNYKLRKIFYYFERNLVPSHSLMELYLH